jgi:transglutaminase-like putative cysteine protease
MGAVIFVGYQMQYEFPQPTPMILNLHVHYSRAADLLRPDHMVSSPQVPMSAYRDSFGNWCTRLIAPAGQFTLSSDAIVGDSGLVEPTFPGAREHPVAELPDDALVFLLGIRYCESDRFTEIAWKLFSTTPPGWSRVQAICDFVNGHIKFGYEHARPTKTAWDAYTERAGVCRDFAHLAIALCRSLNIPARYCAGYLGDIGVPPNAAPMDFAGWFEAYLGGEWRTFDPRNNTPRIGRVLIGRGRDAADVAIATSFGPHTLRSFRVFTDDVSAAQPQNWPNITQGVGV